MAASAFAARFSPPTPLCPLIPSFSSSFFLCPAYALRSLAQNEFYAPKYALYLGNATGAGDAGLLAATSGTPISSQAPHGATTTYFSAAQCASLAGLDCGGETYGESVIRSLNINTAVEWKWGGIGFLGFFLILTNVVSGYALQAVHIERNVGTSRTRDEEEPGAAPGAEGGDGAPASDPAGSAAPSPRGVPLSSTRTVVLVPSIASVLPFERMTVAWRDLK